MNKLAVIGTMVLTVLCAGSPGAAGLVPADSPRMARAKDLISEDRWIAAIPELRAAAADPKEPNRDEALFWLAHSQNQAGDLAEAVESIRRLQSEYSRSRWKEPAGSLLIELAQKLGRHDVLWRTAVPPAAKPVPAPEPPARGSRLRSPRRLAPPPPAAAGAAAPASATDVPAPPAPPGPLAPATWFSDSYLPDTNLRVQALGRLIPTDAPKVIPILRSIALEGKNPSAARRAVFVLAQSRNAQAQSTVLDVAKVGPETVRIAAVRELGRFGGPNVATDLLEVYVSGNGPVKQQVVLALGERADTSSLYRIAQTENNLQLRDAAIMTLGRAGGHEQLRGLFTRASKEARRSVVAGLFLARDEDGLIRIAREEKDPALRSEVHNRLRLLGTAKAKHYLDNAKH